MHGFTIYSQAVNKQYNKVEVYNHNSNPSFLLALYIFTPLFTASIYNHSHVSRLLLKNTSVIWGFCRCIDSVSLGVLSLGTRWLAVFVDVFVEVWEGNRKWHALRIWCRDCHCLCMWQKQGLWHEEVGVCRLYLFICVQVIGVKSCIMCDFVCFSPNLAQILEVLTYDVTQDLYTALFWAEGRPVSLFQTPLPADFRKRSIS